MVIWGVFLDPILVLRKVIGSVHSSAYAYIKPGAMHRYAPGPQPYNYVLLALGLSHEIYRLALDFERASRGEIGLPDIRIGSLWSRALRQGLMVLGVLPSLDLISSIIMSSIALAYGYAKREEKASGFLKALYDFLSATTVRDTLELYDTMRKMGYSEVEELELQGYTRGHIEVEGYKVNDLLRVLSSRHKLFKYTQPYSRVLVEVAEVIVEDYEDTRDLNNAIVRGYLELLVRESKELEDKVSSILELKVTRTKNGLKALYMLDQELRKSGRSYDYLVPVLTLAISIASPNLPV